MLICNSAKICGDAYRCDHSSPHEIIYSGESADGMFVIIGCKKRCKNALRPINKHCVCVNADKQWDE